VIEFLLPLGLGQKTIEIEGEKVRLRTPRIDDFEEWRTLREQSREFLIPWEPSWHTEELARYSYRLRLRYQQKLMAEDAAFAFFIFSAAPEILLGGITLSNIRRGVAQCATLGYWIGAPHARKGYMTDAVKALRAHAFSELSLHRLEAACLPSNMASIGLLERTGFDREGFAKSYLKINGRWEDHILWSCRRDG
jgi:ribosomal-protein-alanine N-acetyltransferase